MKGVPGDRLWVRETFAALQAHCNEVNAAIDARREHESGSVVYKQCKEHEGAPITAWATFQPMREVCPNCEDAARGNDHE